MPSCAPVVSATGAVRTLCLKREAGPALRRAIARSLVYVVGPAPRCYMLARDRHGCQEGRREHRRRCVAERRRG